VAMVTYAPVPKIGIRKGGCYADAFADCSADISREHYVSHALLRLLCVEGRVAIDGFPWQDAGAISRIPPAALGRDQSIICETRGDALSGCQVNGSSGAPARCRAVARSRGRTAQP
jgi:hypothetical protein